MSTNSESAEIIKALQNNYNTPVYFLTSLTLDQLLIVKDLELGKPSENEELAASIAQHILKNSTWPAGLSNEQMDYAVFNKHYKDKSSWRGDVAFYYYIFDKCIPRRNRNISKMFMDRLATFAKASFRELWEESVNWTITQFHVKLQPNKASSKKQALLPQSGEWAADHIMEIIENNVKIFAAPAEEKPCLSVLGAIKKYEDPQLRYNANYLMLYLEKHDGTYVPGFYMHDYKHNKTHVMIPDTPFPGYPEELKNVATI